MTGKRRVFKKYLFRCGHTCPEYDQPVGLGCPAWCEDSEEQIPDQNEWVDGFPQFCRLPQER